MKTTSRQAEIFSDIGRTDSFLSGLMSDISKVEEKVQVENKSKVKKK